jgi:hypothetical protein
MKFIWSFLFCLIIALPLSAQEKALRNQQIEAVKIAFITQKLNLSSTEAEKFWPVYNSYQGELREVFKQRREARSKKAANPNEKLNGELDFEDHLLEIRKKYKQEFSKVIPAEKVLRFYAAEREFREQMIEELKDRRKKQ